MFTGTITALVTPFTDDAFDEPAFRAFVDWQIAEGVHGVVPCGTTGETATLTLDEHRRVVEVCVEQTAGRVPVIAGAGSNDTREAIALTRHAKEVGADAALVVTPYYNKPNQEGLTAHFLAVADAVALPIIMYNIPGRSVISMDVDTMARLCEHPNIVGVKDATGDVARVSRQKAACGPDFIQLSGEDGTALGFNAHGGVGVISVSSNVAPRLNAMMQNACAQADYAAAALVHDRLMPLHDALFSSSSPGPTKYALSRMGLMAPDLRLPLTPPDEASRDQVDAALALLRLQEMAA